MKLKCNDGIVRNFTIAEYDDIYRWWQPSICLCCGFVFGIHDTRILKPKWKSHICKKLPQKEKK